MSKNVTAYRTLAFLVIMVLADLLYEYTYIPRELPYHFYVQLPEDTIKTAQHTFKTIYHNKDFPYYYDYHRSRKLVETSSIKQGYGYFIGPKFTLAVSKFPKGALTNDILEVCRDVHGTYRVIGLIHTKKVINTIEMYSPNAFGAIKTDVPIEYITGYKRTYNKLLFNTYEESLKAYCTHLRGVYQLSDTSCKGLWSYGKALSNYKKFQIIERSRYQQYRNRLDKMRLFERKPRARQEYERILQKRKQQQSKGGGFSLPNLRSSFKQLQNRMQSFQLPTAASIRKAIANSVQLRTNPYFLLVASLLITLYLTTSTFPKQIVQWFKHRAQKYAFIQKIEMVLHTPQTKVVDTVVAFCKAQPAKAKREMALTGFQSCHDKLRAHYSAGKLRQPKDVYNILFQVVTKQTKHSVKKQTKQTRAHSGGKRHRGAVSLKAAPNDAANVSESHKTFQPQYLFRADGTPRKSVVEIGCACALLP